MTVVGMGNEKSISTKDGEGGGLQNLTWTLSTQDPIVRQIYSLSDD